MSFKKIEIDEIRKLININNNKHFDYKLDVLYRDYQNLYFDTQFKNKSVVFKNENRIFIPLTTDPKSKLYSYYGDSIEFISDKPIQKDDYDKIKNYFNDVKGNNVFKFKIKDEKSIIENKIKNIDRVIQEIYIDLSKSIDEIKKEFSSNVRNEIKKDYYGVSFEIVDYDNYNKDEIFNMMDLHIKISGRQTRSEKTWIQNEKMLLCKQGFLIKVIHNNKVVSFSFFYHNDTTCIYLSSVGDRDLYGKIRNMHLKSMWLAINYVKNKCKFFYVGHLTLFSKKKLTEKQINIEKFKSKLRGINSNFVTLSALPEYNYYKDFIG